jgi:hypothetical protein
VIAVIVVDGKHHEPWLDLVRIVTALSDSFFRSLRQSWHPELGGQFIDPVRCEFGRNFGVVPAKPVSFLLSVE